MFCKKFIIFISFLYNILVTCGLSNNGSFDFKIGGKQYDNKRRTPEKQKWITEIFDEAKYRFSMVENVTENCRKDFQLYQLHLSNQSVWAVRMLESSEWPTTSLLAGNTVFMGNWFECTQISAYGINGQICLANATYDFDENEEYDSVEFPPQESSAWSEVKIYRKDPVRVNRQQLKWAMCIPSSCSSVDLKNSLNNHLKPIFEKYQIKFRSDVNPVMCSKTEETNYPLHFYVFWFFLAFYSIFLVLCTFYDMNSKNKIHRWKRIVLVESFSITNNVESLVRPAPLVQRVAHGIKAMATCFIIYAHLLLYILSYPKYSVEDIELDYKRIQLTTTHSALTDMFLLVSGYLACSFGIKTVSKKRGVSTLLLNLFIRWIRMCAPLGILIYFFIYVIPYLEEGPLWKYYVLREANNCRENWWISIFALANIFNVEKQCMVISWYISVDLQLALISCFFLIAINKNAKVGVIITIAFVILGMAITFAVVYLKKLKGVLMFYISILEDPRKSDDFNYQYIATYSRIAPYFVGFLAAYGAHFMMKKDRQFPKFFVRTILYGGIILSELYQFYAFVFYKYGRENNAFENALYAATHRWIFVAPFAFALCCAATDSLDEYISRLSKIKIFRIMGRLSLSTFLVNIVLLLYFFSLQAGQMPTSRVINVYWYTAAAILISYLSGFVFFVMVEAPISNLTTLLAVMLKPNRSQKKSVPKIDNINEKNVENLKGVVNESFVLSNENGKTLDVNLLKDSVNIAALKDENCKC